MTHARSARLLRASAFTVFAISLCGPWGRVVSSHPVSTSPVYLWEHLDRVDSWLLVCVLAAVPCLCLLAMAWPASRRAAGWYRVLSCGLGAATLLIALVGVISGRSLPREWPVVWGPPLYAAALWLAAAVEIHLARRSRTRAWAEVFR